MKKNPKKDARNSRRIHDQQKREDAIKKGDPDSSTPQGAGLGNSTQLALEEPLSAGLAEQNPRFEPIDPESERSAAEKKSKKNTDKKSKRSKNTKPESKSQHFRKNDKDDDPAHWEGEGEPGYASHNTDQTRTWSEKEE